jgi:hypothetical protein
MTDVNYVTEADFQEESAPLCPSLWISQQPGVSRAK